MVKYYAVDYKDGKIGVLDKSDGVLEYHMPSVLREVIKNGIKIRGLTLAEDMNPMFTIEGLKVNLAYKEHKKFGKWIVVLLKSGDRFGQILKTAIEKDTVAFYDSSVKWNKDEYPFGQYVASYYKDTILSHYGDLCLDTSVKSWTVSEDEIENINDWLISLM